MNRTIIALATLLSLTACQEPVEVITQPTPFIDSKTDAEAFSLCHARCILANVNSSQLSESAELIDSSCVTLCDSDPYKFYKKFDSIMYNYNGGR